MYLYCISTDCYADYQNTLISHETKFTKSEFIDMYNQVIGNLKRATRSADKIAELMCEKYGFKIQTFIFEINAEYDPFQVIPETEKQTKNIHIESDKQERR